METLVRIRPQQLHQLLTDGQAKVPSSLYEWGQLEIPTGDASLVLSYRQDEMEMGYKLFDPLPRFKQECGPDTTVCDIASGTKVPYWKEGNEHEEKHIPLSCDEAAMARTALYAAAALSRDNGHVEQANRLYEVAARIESQLPW